jgi:L-aminopeptidase/D-esterase-like protein
VGSATVRSGEVVVSALVALNAWGDLRGAAHLGSDPRDLAAVEAGLVAQRDAQARAVPPAPFAHTTIGVVATNAKLDKVGCLLVAQSGHDGLARALEPVHAIADGDALVAAGLGPIDAPIEVVRLLAARAVESAVRSVPDAH